MRYVGVDLAWGQRNRTGLAALDGAGRLLELASARSDAEILEWLEVHTSGPCLVALDAPLIVTNVSGRRRCEAELGRVFARYDAGAHPTSTARPELANGSRALHLARALDLDVDPGSSADRRAIEVYPHPATIALFGLEHTLKYKHKPGRDLALLRSESLRLVRLLEGLEEGDPPLLVRHHPVWRQVRGGLRGATRKADLKRVEDLVDAVLCAYVGLFVHRRPERTTVFGDLAEGYIVTPALPAAPAPPT
jgi:predicted RNase H-like nuclease